MSPRTRVPTTWCALLGALGFSALAIAAGSSALAQDGASSRTPGPVPSDRPIAGGGGKPL